MAQDSAMAFERWRPVINAAKCVKCGACVAVCPNQAIEEPLDYCCAKCVKYCLGMEVPCEPGHMKIRDELCDGCGRCIVACSHDAID